MSSQALFVLLVVILWIVGIGCFALAFWHERMWWMRRSWIRCAGRIVGLKERLCSDGTTYVPEIEFEVEGRKERFFSKYSSYPEPKIGTSVDVVFSLDLGEAEQLSISNRLLFTVVPIFFGVVVILLAITTRPLEDNLLRDSPNSHSAEKRVEPVFDTTEIEGK